MTASGNGNSSSRTSSATYGVVEKFNLHIKSGAVEALAGVPQKTCRRLIALIRKLAVDPVPEGAERLSGADKYRLRHEDFRLVYRVDSEGMRVVVARIARRQPQMGSQ